MIQTKITEPTRTPFNPHGFADATPLHAFYLELLEKGLINKVLEERLMELAFEGDRWFDLKRMGKAIQVLSQQKDGNGNVLPFAANINQNRLLWPIPQDKLDANAQLTQNPGY